MLYAILQAHHQAARPLVSLCQVHVVKRQTDFQRANDFDVLNRQCSHRFWLRRCLFRLKHRLLYRVLRMFLRGIWQRRCSFRCQRKLQSPLWRMDGHRHKLRSWYGLCTIKRRCQVNSVLCSRILRRFCLWRQGCWCHRFQLSLRYSQSSLSFWLWLHRLHHQIRSRLLRQLWQDRQDGRKRRLCTGSKLWSTFRSVC